MKKNIQKTIAMLGAAVLVMGAVGCGSSLAPAETKAESAAETTAEAKTEAETAAACSHCQGACHGTQDDAF